MKTPEYILSANRAWHRKNRTKVRAYIKKWSAERRAEIMKRYGPCVCGSSEDLSIRRASFVPKLKGASLDAWIVKSDYPEGAIVVRCLKCVRDGKFRLSGKQIKKLRLERLGAKAISDENMRSFNKYRARNLSNMRQRSVNLKYRAMAGYSNPPVCALCGDSRFHALELDHVKGDGSEHRKQKDVYSKGMYRWSIENGFPDNLRVLCSNCNILEHLRISGKNPNPIRAKFIEKLGGKCEYCETTDVRILVCHHGNNGGCAARRKESHGIGGWVYLKKYLNADISAMNFKCMCYSCHRVHHATENKRPLPTALAQPVPPMSSIIV